MDKIFQTYEGKWSRVVKMGENAWNKNNGKFHKKSHIFFTIEPAKWNVAKIHEPTKLSAAKMELEIKFRRNFHKPKMTHSNQEKNLILGSKWNAEDRPLLPPGAALQHRPATIFKRCWKGLCLPEKGVLSGALLAGLICISLKFRYIGRILAQFRGKESRVESIEGNVGKKGPFLFPPRGVFFCLLPGVCFFCLLPFLPRFCLLPGWKK